MADNVEDLDLTPPQTAQDNAQKVLDWRDEHGDEVNGMTRTGWVRANQLAGGEELSPDIVGRMSSFNRHRGNSGVAEEYEGEPWKDAGHVAWLGWGGDAGVDWAMRMSDRIDSIENTGQDKITTLSHKHVLNDENENSDMEDEDSVENSAISDKIKDNSAGDDSDVESIGSNEISKNTYNGYFEGKEFDNEDWRNAVDRLRELHGTSRSFMTHIVRHEDSGHGRGENVPVFEEPIDSDTIEQFAKNVEGNVDEETFERVVEDMNALDNVVRRLFFRMIMHDDFMHDRAEFDVEQLLSDNTEENASYSTLEDCVDDYASSEDYDREEAEDVCMDIMNLDEDEERKNVKEAELLAEQLWVLKDVMNQFGDEFEQIAMKLENEDDISEVLALEDRTLKAVDLMMSKIKSPVESVEEGFVSSSSVEMADQEDLEEGTKVRWDSSGGNAYGVIDTVTTEGTVSAEPEGPDMDGSEDEPAYKIQVYDVEDEEWSGTETYVVHRADTLTVIEDFPETQENSEHLAQGIMPTHDALEDFGSQESDSWDRPDYSEFQDSYDFEENFADLSNDDKRLVAAHFGRVDASSYDDAAYSDLQLPHHNPENGDVDRAAVIAARQRLPQSDMPQEDLEAIDTHLANHLRNDFDEENVNPIIERENSDLDTEEETYTGREIENGQLVSYNTDYGKGYGRVKELTAEDRYSVEVYSAKLGGGWSASGETQVLSKEDVTKEGKLPQSMDDVFNKSNNAEAETVQENSEEDMDSEEVDTEENSEQSSEKLSPAKVQQVGKKVRSVAEVMEDDMLEDYLNRKDLDYSAEEFRDLVEDF